ncbi:hypothetical protein ACTL6U_14380 [Rhodovibrionaceae bacterium A322]
MSSFRAFFVACSLPLFLVACKTPEPVKRELLVLDIEPAAISNTRGISDHKAFVQFSVARNARNKANRGSAACFEIYHPVSDVNPTFVKNVKEILESYFSEVVELDKNENATKVLQPGDVFLKIETDPVETKMNVHPPAWFGNDWNVHVASIISGEVNYELDGGVQDYWSFKGVNFTSEPTAAVEIPGLSATSEERTAAFKTLCTKVPKLLKANLQASYDEALMMFTEKLEKYVINK